ncbi:MAG TPA: archaeosine biosynthesis radical SAM protein RaSEA [Methanothrix sp.]|nr:archaeosine biosynthesis radical SAM protein RaSEA [Methanothrix sp.]HPJ83418.1 archaeosine biosynthesis radical SAM protein RaSEA [Methanothrix sp.]HPR66627.1 archaeosine biosynthesis radical SAM protein RaSEA [Methanothrix sp.]
MDLLDGEAAGCLTIILRTRGCRWRRCTMCGYAAEGAPATEEDLMVQFRAATKDLSSEDRVVKIYTSGSFLDPAEVPESVRTQILDDLSAADVEKLVVESRPEYVTSERVEDSVARIRTEVAMGLETSSDLVRDHSIRKGFSFEDFRAAAKTVHGVGGSVKTYLLLKPPFLSEGVAISDALRSARDAAPHSDVLSLNLANIQRGTLMERMWMAGDYRPPWLWSAIDVLKKVTFIPIICDPVAAGTRRGPSNCGRCDEAVARAIMEHALTQDAGVFEDLDCGCRAAWEKVVELEDYSFGAPLF